MHAAEAIARTSSAGRAWLRYLMRAYQHNFANICNTQTIHPSINKQGGPPTNRDQGAYRAEAVLCVFLVQEYAGRHLVAPVLLCSLYKCDHNACMPSSAKFGFHIPSNYGHLDGHLNPVAQKSVQARWVPLMVAHGRGL